MNLLSKHWSEDEIERYVGPCRSAYIGYAADDMIRLGAASGGIVSAMLIYALESGMIDGAVVCRTVVRDGRVRNAFVAARSRGEILDARGSSYVASAFVPEVFDLIRAFEGRLAVVGLPCDLKNLASWGGNHPADIRKVVLTLSLFCGHASQPELVDAVASRMGSGGSASLERFRFRSGRWRGKMLARFSDGSVEERPFGDFGLYQNLFFFCSPKCLHCCDHFGYSADLSAGDVWDYRLRKSPVKHSGLLCRSGRGEEIVRSAMEAGALLCDEVPVARILDGQRRSAPSHYNVSARARAGRRFGIVIRDTVGARVRWHEYLAAWIRLANYRWSRSERAPLIFKTPKPLLKLWLYLMKGLESLS
jgi:coenzyme F420-reducing hydrogenase beta subunit